MKLSQIERKGFIQGFEGICQDCNSTKLKIVYRWEDKEEEKYLTEILPKGFCIMAFQSIYPYMQTLVNGGWFNWVNYGEHVIVNCPSPEGIAMYVKSLNAGSPHKFEIEVIKDRYQCYKRYSVKDRFPFVFDEKSAFIYEMFYRIIPFIDKSTPRDRFPMDFSCIYRRKVIYYQIRTD